jgi:hypothetical protein
MTTPHTRSGVRGFWLFLRANGIDASLGLPGSEERRDWAQWMTGGNPALVAAESLMQALRQAGRPRVPLIVLSSCLGGSTAAQAMAAGLAARGADRVIAMLTPVTDGYATQLARHLCQELATRRDLTVGQADGADEPGRPAE